LRRFGWLSLLERSAAQLGAVVDQGSRHWSRAGET
jgi:hypothetical protein